MAKHNEVEHDGNGNIYSIWLIFVTTIKYIVFLLYSSEEKSKNE